VTYTHAMEDKRQETMDGETKNNAVGRETEDADRNHSLEDERPRINDKRQRMEDMLQNIGDGGRETKDGGQETEVRGQETYRSVGASPDDLGLAQCT